MLSALIKREHGERSLFFPGKTIRLHSMIASCGFSKEIKQSYDWYGLRRGKAEFALFQYCIKGFGKLLYEGNEYRVMPGQAMLLHFPHHNRYWLPAESKEWEFIYVCLYGSEILRIWKELEQRAGPLVGLDAQSAPVSTASEIIHSCVFGDGYSGFASSQKAYQLAMQLSDLIIKPSAQPASDSYRTHLDKALELCKRNLQNPLTVDDMAGAAGYSRYHFTRIFSASEGMSPKEYLHNLRVQKAIGLLQANQGSIKEIAAACGFNDVNYFCRAFRKTIGLSPGVFRKSGMYSERYR